MATSTKLTFTLPNGSEQKYLLSRDGTYTFGNSADNDISLPDPVLPAKYGKIAADETNDSRWFIRVLESGAIIVLEHGSEEQFGHTHLSVSITDVAPAKEEAAPDAPAPVPPPPPGATPTKSPTPEGKGRPDNEKQLEELRRVQEVRDFTHSAITIAACGILSFLAGVAWRIIEHGL